MSYRAGLVERLGEVEPLPAITIEATDLPDDGLALLDQHLLDLGGTYGDPEAGDPIQYDDLRIQGDVEIVVYNRPILVFTTDSEAVRRIHEVCWPAGHARMNPRGCRNEPVACQWMSEEAPELGPGGQPPGRVDDDHDRLRLSRPQRLHPRRRPPRWHEGAESFRVGRLGAIVERRLRRPEK